MTDDKLKRINELAAKSRECALSEDELAEQAQLRREYIERYKASLRAQLDNTYFEDSNGNRSPLRRKSTKEQS